MLSKDIKKIQSLAEKVKIHLSKKRISKAEKEIKHILEINAEEITELEQKMNNSTIIAECFLILQEAKKALRTLEDSELVDEVKEIIDNILIIEQREKLELAEIEKAENELYELWYTKIRNFVWYHGTSSLSFDKIKKYGLNPGMIPWDEHDIKRLDFLIKKAGYEYGVGIFYNSTTIGNDEKGIFLTPSIRTAESYAKRSPEMWSQFVTDSVWENRDYTEALKKVGYYLTYRKAANIKMLITDYNVKLSLIYADKKAFFVFVEEFCPLKKSELNEVYSILNKYWQIFIKSKPIILHISSQAPAISEHYPECASFENFKSSYISYQKKKDLSPVKMCAIILNTFNLNVDFKVKKRIESKYILKYEYL